MLSAAGNKPWQIAMVWTHHSKFLIVTIFIRNIMKHYETLQIILLMEHGGSWKKKQDAASRPQMGVLAGTREAPTAIDFINFDSTGQPSV